MSREVRSKPGCCATLASLARTATGLPSVGLGLGEEFIKCAAAGLLLLAVPFSVLFGEILGVIGEEDIFSRT
jgi:hypothetical protein